MSAALQARQVSVSYGALTALADIDLAFEPGSRVGIFGHNGAGKTTLLRCLMGAVVPRAGRVEYQGQPISPNVPDNVKRGMAFVPQGHAVFPNLSVEQNLRISGLLFDQAFVKRIYELFPVLEERRGQRAGSLSGGEQQMLALGMALMTQPKWLFLDEPSTGLAPVIVRNVMRNLREVSESLNTGLIIVEQNIPATLKIVQRAIIIKAGRAIFDGPASELESQTDLWQWL